MKNGLICCLALVMGMVLFVGAACSPAPAPQKTTAEGLVAPSAAALETADYALKTYREDIIRTLGELVSFRTVNAPGSGPADNPEFARMTEYLKNKAAELGFDFEDHGAVVVIGYGSGEKKLGLIVHADVQPVDATKWRKDPFTLDRESEPELLVARGAEDDKGPLAIALYALKSLKDRAVPLDRRIELLISYTEESDWNPFIEFVKTYQAGDLNIALDDKYPLVRAEKGWCGVMVHVPAKDVSSRKKPWLKSFTGGAFMSQVPEDATAVIGPPTPETEAILKEAIRKTEDGPVTYSLEYKDKDLIVSAHGKSAHSSEPENGYNGIAFLAHLIANLDVLPSQASIARDFINDMIGLGYLCEQFGDIAYSDSFMGPLTMVLATLKEEEGDLVIGINLRRPAGKEGALLEEQIRAAIAAWCEKKGLPQLRADIYISEPHLVEDAPDIKTLLGIYAHFTGDPNSQALSSGGSTHARLLPNGVSFGPHMPGRAYTGHTEHEYLSLKELDLDIRIYAAMMVQLAAR